MRSKDTVAAYLLLLSGWHATIAADPDDQDWSYVGKNGPSHWPGLCQTGKRQSPIPILTDEAIRADLDDLKFVRYDFAFPGVAINTGYSIQINLHGIPIHLKDGSLPSIYVLEQMHFHWNAEHTIDGVRYPLELHLVHYDTYYGNFSNASQHRNGIVVVATLFELSSEDNYELEPILEAIEIVSPWIGPSTINIPSKIVPYLLLPNDRSSYFRYEGSLTTPQCEESVLWFIMADRLSLSESQLNVFKNVKTANGTLKFNNRPLQKPYDRKVYHHLLGYNSGTSLNSNFACKSFSILVCLAKQLGSVFNW